MYRLTKAYRTWNNAPENIHEATCPEDFARGIELKLLLIDGLIAHFLQHVKQHLGIHTDLFCECCEFEKWGL